MTVTPALDTILVRATLQLQAVARDSAGVLLSGRVVTWNVDDTSRATVTTAGLLTARKLGTAQVTATSEGKSGGATITLVPTVAVLRALPSLFVGDTTLLTVTFRDALGGLLAPVDTTWTSGDTTVTIVSPNGVVTAIRTGQAVVAAAGGGAKDSQTVVVLPLPSGATRHIGFTRDLLRYDGLRPPTLWAVNPDDSVSTRVSTDTEFVADFDQSTDGARYVVTYANYQGIGRTTSLVTTATGAEQQDLHVFALGPQWSPDNTSIAFSAAVAGHSEIHVIHPDGTGNLRLTYDGENSMPMWSPDGRQIAFVHRAAVDSIGFVRPDGTGRRTVPMDAGFLGGPRWSPDGKLLAFTNGSREVWLASADGSHPKRICGTADGCDAWRVEWSPDASALVIDGANVLHVLDLDGTVLLTVPTAPPCCSAFHGGPVWSPDGSRIAYLAIPDTGLPVRRVWVVNANGSNPRAVTPADTTNPAGLQWRP